MVELRDYQKILLHRVETALDNDPKSRVMMQLPTGGGKTVIAGELLKRQLVNGRKAVWLTHRRELAEQTCRMLTAANVSAKTNLRWDVDTDAPDLESGVVILTAQRLSRRTAVMEVWDKYNENDLMMIDEAHHAAAKSWERAMDQWPGGVLGMTATPWRLSKKEGFDHLFDTLILGPQVADLQSSEYLSNAKVLMPPPKQRILGGHPVGDRDYNESDIMQANSDRPDVMTARALSFWEEHAEGRQTIVYAVSVGHARNVVRLFKDANIPAEIVLGVASPKEQAERGRAVDAFRDGRLKVLVNVLVPVLGIFDKYKK